MCKKLFDTHDGADDPRLFVADFNVCIFEWSDNFKSNTSLTKSNYGSVWVKTVAFVPPDTHHHLNGEYTYPVVTMGPKNTSPTRRQSYGLLPTSSGCPSIQGLLIYSKLHGGLIRIAKIISSHLFVALRLTHKGAVGIT
jgi:hypothetical protein